MFTVHCPRHQARVLLGPRSIERLVTTADGVEVHWRCHCGAQGAHVTGRRAEATTAHRLATPAAA